MTPSFFQHVILKLTNRKKQIIAKYYIKLYMDIHIIHIKIAEHDFSTKTKMRVCIKKPTGSPKYKKRMSSKSSLHLEKQKAILA